MHPENYHWESTWSTEKRRIPRAHKSSGGLTDKNNKLWKRQKKRVSGWIIPSLI